MKKVLTQLCFFFLLSSPGIAQAILDATFNANQILPPPHFMTVRTLVVQPDGKILFGGTSDYDNSPRADGPSFGRLNPDGSWDTPFQNNVGYTANTGFYFTPGGIQERTMALNGGVTVRDLVLLDDGKIIVVGDFAMFNSTSVVSIARLNANGTLDTFGERGGFTDYFVPGLPGFGINAVARQSDGRLIVGGSFTATGDGSLSFGYIARVDANGNIDPVFSGEGNPGDIGFNSGVDDLEIQPDGKVVVAGRFSAFRNAPCGPLARLNPDYTLDAAFSAAQGTGFSGGQITKVALQPDGKIIVAGSFSAFNGISKAGLLRLNSDGSLDTSFDPGTGPAGTIYSLAIQQDGKLIVGGSFTSFNGTTRSGITRLNQNGGIDSTFSPASGVGGRPNDGVLGVYALAIQPNRRILAGGEIGSYDGISRNSIVRLIDVALPVRLISFNVKTEGNQAVLHWSTSFETNSESFGIERSTNGKDWKTIGDISASRESSDLKEYAFVDPSPLYGNNLYRLKMIDADQTFAYSRIQSAVFGAENPVVVYPNPSRELIYFRNVRNPDFKQAMLYNKAGAEINLKTHSADGEPFMDVSGLQSGLYVLKIWYRDGTSTSSKILIGK